MHGFVKRDEPRRVPLLEHQVVQGRRQVRSVRQFAHGTLPLIVHGRRRIEHNVVTEVGLLLVSLDVVAVGLRVHLPVDMPKFVPGVVRAMFGEFDGESVVWAPVQTRDKPLDDQARPKLHVA